MPLRYDDNDELLTPSDVREFLIEKMFNLGLYHAFHGLPFEEQRDPQDAISYEVGRQMAASMRADKQPYRGPGMIDHKFQPHYARYFAAKYTDFT